MLDDDYTGTSEGVYTGMLTLEGVYTGNRYVIQGVKYEITKTNDTTITSLSQIYSFFVTKP